MASILRHIVAGPRLQHPEAGLDLCYVTDFLIATSGPSSTYPQRAYRNPTDALVKFLDSKHGVNWSIWEFRAEGTGYPDSEVYGRIHHFPWPDHHPPPFALIPAIMASMRNWLHGEDPGDRHNDDDGNSKNGGADGAKTTKMQTTATRRKDRVAVVHCKAGKGRSGTVACSYLISQDGWKMEDALKRFTERRMRAGFGNGVSIPSQVRWVGYVDRWANGMDKIYVERPVEILEIHIWGLRDGVKIAIEGFVDEGRKIKCFHLFRRSERTVVDDGKGNGNGNRNNARISKANTAKESRVEGSPLKHEVSPSSASSSSVYAPAPAIETVTSPTQSGDTLNQQSPTAVSAVILRPNKPVILPTSDVNIDFERRTKAAYTGWAMVTSIAHVWFNVYFEGGDKHDSGVFEKEWEALDGIRGSTRKGTKALERVKVVWRYPTRATPADESEKTAVTQRIEDGGQTPAPPPPGKVISVPRPGEPVPESHAADWRGDTVMVDNEKGCEPEDNGSVIALSREENNPTGKGTTSSSKSSSPSSTKIPLRTATSLIRKLSLTQSAKDSKGLTGEDHPLVTEATTAAATAATSAAKKIRKELGLRKQTPASRDISLAPSMEDLKGSAKDQQIQQDDVSRKHEQEGVEGVKTLEQQSDEQVQGGRAIQQSKGEAKNGEEHDSDIEGVRPYFSKNGE